MSSPSNKPPSAPDTLPGHAEGDEIVQRASVVIRRSQVRALVGEPNKIRVSRWLALFCCPHRGENVAKKLRCHLPCVLQCAQPRRTDAPSRTSRSGRPSAAQVFQFVTACSRLMMPGGPGMPQIVEAEIGKPRLPHRFKPAGIADAPSHRLAAVREARARMLPLLRFEDCDRILIQR